MLSTSGMYFHIKFWYLQNEPPVANRKQEVEFSKYAKSKRDHI